VAFSFIKNEKVVKILAIIFLCLFVGVLCVGTVGQVQITPQATKISFDFSQNFCDKKVSLSFLGLTKFDIVTNLLMLLPVGIFVVYFYRKNFIKTALLLIIVGVCCGFIIELTQFILPIKRSVQLSDAVFNAISVILGGIIGFIYLKLGKIIKKKIYKTH
jgi:VanZ family protein